MMRNDLCIPWATSVDVTDDVVTVTTRVYAHDASGNWAPIVARFRSDAPTRDDVAAAIVDTQSGYAARSAMRARLTNPAAWTAAELRAERAPTGAAPF